MTVQWTELTPRGRGGVSVVALTGSHARTCLADWIDPWPPGWQPADPPRLVRLRLADLELTEEALVWWQAAEAFELHLHGSPPLVDALKCRALNSNRQSARYVADGHALAFGGVLDPVGALEQRAAQVLASAETRAAARVLLDQAEGALRTELTLWLASSAAERAKLAEELIEYGRAAQRLLEPARVVLAGPVNMGKSTLFNLLVGAERVVVSDVAGTTRDVIEAAAQLGAYPIRLLDTAGHRLAEGAMGGVEAAGQEQGLRAAQTGDWVVWMTRDGTAPPAMQVPRTVFVGRGDEASRDDANVAGLARLAPLREPAESLRAVQKAFLRALDLPAEPRRPGRGVAFDAETRELVQRLAVNKNPKETEQAVHAILS